MGLFLNVITESKFRAILILFIAVLVAAALFSYDHRDPCWSVATDSMARNWLMSPGAYVADILYQLFGQAALLVPILLTLAAGYILTATVIKWFYLRIVFLIIAQSLASLATHIHPLPLGYEGPSGVLGLLMYRMLYQFQFIQNSKYYIDTILPWFSWVLSFALIYCATNFRPIKLAIYIYIQLKKITCAAWGIVTSPFRYVSNMLGNAASKIQVSGNKMINSGASIMESIRPGPIANTEEDIGSYSAQEIKPPPVRLERAPATAPFSSQRQTNANTHPQTRPHDQSQAKIQPARYAGDGDVLPSLDLLADGNNQHIKPQSAAELEQRSQELLTVLNDFGVKGKIVDVKEGPVVTMYEFEPAAGTKSSRVIGLADDIARSLCALSTRISVIAGRNALGIELPNKQRMFFRLKELIKTAEFQDQFMSLPLILGKDLAGAPMIVDLAKMPHLLVAGTTGSGKSVAINAMIMSLLYRYRPDQCRMIMIDPKMLELSAYDNIPHLMTPVVTEPGKAVVALKWAVKEMENRYRLMSHIGVRNIGGYNQKIEEALQKGQVLERNIQTGFDPETGKPIHERTPIEMVKMPFIVVIVDEMADLMLVAGKDIESSIQRLAQMARAAGIHIIMATQRPSVDVITGVIKANFPSRISFKVTSKIDSRTILGEQGSEQLLGMGDMLYMGNSSRILRVHGPFVEDAEVERVTDFLRSTAEPDYISAVTEVLDDDSSLEDGDDDGSMSDKDLYRQAYDIVKTERKSSISYIQRRLRIGYNKAASLVEELEAKGVLSPANSSGKREILLPEE